MKTIERTIPVRKAMLLLFLLGLCSYASAARVLPHLDLVKRYLQSPGETSAKVTSCPGTYMSADRDNIECWAAHTARDLAKLQDDARELVLDSRKQEAVLSKCKAMAMDGRLKSRECAAAGKADTFISLRLPRLKLEPLKFN
jgi:hypothetical protein